MSHSHAANPNAAWTGISSPGSVPNVPAAAVATNTNAIASVSITTWPASFSVAIRRRVTGEAARISMLPRRDFGGERRGQGEDRPQRRDQGEEPAVLVLDVATQRFDVDRPAGEARQDRRNGGHQVADLLARLGGRELGRDRLRDDHQQDADEQRDRDRRAARITDGLAEDAAEAEDPAAQRGTTRGAAGRG